MRRLHGRRGHRAPGPERPADARARAPRSARSRRARRRSRTRSTRRCATGSRTSRRPTTSSARRWGRTRIPTIVRDLQRRIGDEAAAQLAAVEGRLPDLALACVGGGSNAIGLLARFIGEPSVRLAVVEAAGDGIETGRHAAAILGGTPGILHGSRSLMLQDADGQVIEAHSASAGLDYPGIGPQLAALAEGGRIEVAAATDREAVAAMKTTTRTEGILPALETAHADRGAPQAAGRGRRGRRLVAGRGPRPPRVLRPRRQGPRRARAVRRRRAVGGRPVSVDGTLARRPRPARTRPPAPGGSRPPSPGRGRTAAPRSSRTSSPAIPTPTRASRSRSPRPMPAPTCSRSGCRIRTRWPTARRSSAPRASRWPPGATLERSLQLIERIGAARPDLPLVPMGYANQVIGGGDGEAVAKRLAGAGAAGLIVADLTPDEGAPFEAVARAAGLAVVYLVAPTTPPARRARDRRPERRLPVLRVARRRDRRADVAADDGRAPGPRRPRRVAGPGRRRVRGQPPGPRPRASRRPAPTASSSPRPSSTRSDPTAATSPGWPAWSAHCVPRPDPMGHHPLS